MFLFICLYRFSTGDANPSTPTTPPSRLYCDSHHCWTSATPWSPSSPTTSAPHTYPNRASPSPWATTSTLRSGSATSTTSTPCPTFALGSVHPLAHHRGEQGPLWACSRPCWSQAKESAKGKGLGPVKLSLGLN